MHSSEEWLGSLSGVHSRLVVQHLQKLLSGDHPKAGWNQKSSSLMHEDGSQRHSMLIQLNHYENPTGLDLVDIRTTGNELLWYDGALPTRLDAQIKQELKMKWREKTHDCEFM